VANPTVFISYSWDDDAHKGWVRDLATRLRANGVDVKLDQWETAPGDRLPAFMERAIRDNTYVLIICTPRYKARSEKREGGVGYEGDIMTAEVLTTGNQRKFIPILRRGTWAEAAPSWLLGKYYIDLGGEPYPERGYEDLLTTIYGTRPQAPPLGPVPKPMRKRKVAATPVEEVPSGAAEGIKIKGIIVDEVTEPRMDGTRGSALYRIPFQLSRRPSPEWAHLFVEVWNRPPRYTTMHRPGIASVQGDRIILDGTTVEEVEKYHRDTLILVVKTVNEDMAQREDQRRQQDERRRQESEEHRKRVEDASKKISFDE
jgi:hypothetical protein